MGKHHEYLVSIEVLWPPEGDRELRDRLIAEERETAARLAESGIIVRLWRVPGRWANWGIWRAANVEQLHDAIASLPFFPWLSVTVHPLALHPSDPGSGAIEGLEGSLPDRGAIDA